MKGSYIVIALRGNVWLFYPAAKSALMAAGWGDEESLQSGPLNPYYDSDQYLEYPDFVRRNLARLNEDILDLDFIEEMISWADEQTPLPGAILVFLPGMAVLVSACEVLLYMVVQDQEACRPAQLAEQ